ncbi:MAG TPA: 3-hydroxybutyryl-CoA dehydrogenase [Chloroflexia bacterium]|nr:3-hydroxybutyryl-CoA dehydrogenase [Chloroflexia bacterium]
MDIKTIGVVGAGTMGNGIAQVCAQAGYHVIMNDREDAFVQRGLSSISKSLGKLAEKGKFSAEERDAIYGRITPSTALEDLSRADLVIEAVFEKLEVKRDVLARLDAICRPETILASNTSSISITKLAAATKRPEKVIGMHFFNPVPIMQLIEIIRALQTSQETFDTIRELSVKLGKTPVAVQDSPGFVTNRVLMPLLNEAMFTLMEGVASAEDIDTAVKLGLNHPMGPLTLADYVGLDVCLDVMEVLHRELGDPKFRPCPLLRKMVDAGYLGRKSGQGFYKY